MTQTVKRKDLLEIYNNVCQSWKEEITKLVLSQTTDDIEVGDEIIKRAYSEADSTQKKMLNKYFKIKEGINLKNIKSFDDILKLANLKEENILIFKNPSNKNEVKINAYNKLLLIVTVLNEGWEPDFSNHSQSKYYPYFMAGSGGLVYSGYASYFYLSHCIGEAVFYKDSNLAKLAGTVFIKEYNEFLLGIIV